MEKEKKISKGAQERKTCTDTHLHDVLGESRRNEICVSVPSEMKNKVVSSCGWDERS